MLGKLLNKKWVFLMLSLLLMGTLFTIAGCEKRKELRASKIIIAQQYGLPYAPLQIVKDLGLIEKKLPEIEVQWKQLGNTAAIREAMLAGELDVGFMAIPPFLIGWDKGMDWRIACGLSSSPVGLITSQDHIRKLADFSESDRIALPQPGSVQHILLAMACEKEFGNPKHLDNLLLTMAHPDGMNALLARRDVTAHFTTPPYLFRELEAEGMRKILDGKEAMGEDFTFIVGVAPSDFYRERPLAYKALLEAIQEAIKYMEEYPVETSKSLSEAYGIELSEVSSYLQQADMNYSLEVKGVMRFAEFMYENGYLTKKPLESEVFWGEQIGK